MEGKDDGNENKGNDNVVIYNNTGSSNLPAIEHSVNPMNDLEMMREGYIRQVVDNYEQSKSCHSKNAYLIYGYDGSNTMKHLFKAKEN